MHWFALVFLLGFGSECVMAAGSFAAKRVAKNLGIVGAAAVATKFVMPYEEPTLPGVITDPHELAQAKQAELMKALQRNNADQAIKLLHEGVDPNFKDSHDRTFMNYALVIDMPADLVREAIRKGLHLNTFDARLRGTFLDCAVIAQKYEIAMHLFEAGCVNTIPSEKLIQMMVEKEKDSVPTSHVYRLILAFYRGSGRDKRVLAPAVWTAYWQGKTNLREFLMLIDKFDREWP